MNRSWPYIVLSLIAIVFTVFYLWERAFVSAAITLLLAGANLGIAYIILDRSNGRD